MLYCCYSGEILQLTHIARGLDKDGILQIDMIIEGDVPQLPHKAKIILLPYVEDYIQTGPGNRLTGLHYQIVIFTHYMALAVF